jgi:ABC-2 type transport system ATP-binding protein
VTEVASDLVVSALAKRYGDIVALDDLSLNVESGELFGFVGSNGAGKTTTMRIVMGLVAADRGQVLWRGQPLGLTERRRIGYMPEERGLYPKMRIAEQLAYLARLHGMGASEARAAAQRWLDRLGLGSRGRDELQALSHGNQQRAQLAAALVFAPDLLILDEPFAGLDPIATDVMTTVLREQADRGVPVVFSSHQLELVEAICDRVGIVASGHLVAQGTVAELGAQAPRRLWVDAPQAPPGWASGLAGTTVVRSQGTRLLLELDPATDDQHVLRAALATGAVRAFEPVRPSLADVFRDVVSEPAKEVVA